MNETVDLSLEERKALNVIVLFSEKNLARIRKECGISHGGYYNKINGKSKFTRDEFNRLLNVLGISEKTLRDCASSYILTFITGPGERSTKGVVK